MSAQPLDLDRTAERTFRAVAYAPWWRLLATVAYLESRASLPAMLLAVLYSRTLTPFGLLRWFALLFAVPALVAAAIGRVLAASVHVDGEELTIVGAGVRVDVPWDAITHVLPWRLPVPLAGFALGLRSGRRLRYGLAAADPVPMLGALAARGIASAETAMRHAAIVYAHARAASGRWRWFHLVARFPLFALVPTALLFNVHQHIAYGGLLGQYYMLGLGPYLQTFALYWATVTVYQVLWAGAWRGLAEPICLLAAAVAPSRAAGVRRAAELSIRVLYYGGVVAILALRFAPW